MTMTNDNQPAEVPAWLNIDMLVDDDLRQSVQMALGELKAQVRPTLRALYIARQVSDDFAERAVGPNTGDDVNQLVRKLVGMGELWDIVQLIEGVAGSITGCCVDGDELERLASRYYDHQDET